VPSAVHRDGQRAHGLKTERGLRSEPGGVLPAFRKAQDVRALSLLHSPGTAVCPPGRRDTRNLDGAPPKATPLMSSFSAFLNFSIVLRFDHLRLSSFNAWILPHFAALADDLNVAPCCWLRYSALRSARGDRVRG